MNRSFFSSNPIQPSFSSRRSVENCRPAEAGNGALGAAERACPRAAAAEIPRWRGLGRGSRLGGGGSRNGRRESGWGGFSGWLSALGDARTGLDQIDPQLDQAREFRDRESTRPRPDWKGTLGRLVNEARARQQESRTSPTTRATRSPGSTASSRGSAGGSSSTRSRGTSGSTPAPRIRARADKFYLVEFERGPLGGLPHDALSDVVKLGPTTRGRLQNPGQAAVHTSSSATQLGPLALRGGNQGLDVPDVGADALMLDGRLKLSARRHTARSPRTPELKLTGALAVFESSYVLAGGRRRAQTRRATCGCCRAPRCTQGCWITSATAATTSSAPSLQFTDEDVAVLLYAGRRRDPGRRPALAPPRKRGEQVESRRRRRARGPLWRAAGSARR